MENLFHEHLERCRHCREHPFDPCRGGQACLEFAVGKVETEGPPPEEVEIAREGKPLRVISFQLGVVTR